MRVLVVDQDSAMLESIARSLRDRYTVDAVTNKGDCLDLLKQNAFEVIVAGERLEDGSGLELLSQAAKRWPAMLRIFAADRQRLQLLKGRLGPFELFQTLGYPINPDRLLDTLELADAAQDANADTSNIQHVVLGSDVCAEVAEESEHFPQPKPEPRAVPPPEPPRIASLRSVSRSGAPLRVSRTVASSRPRSSGSVAVAEPPDPPSAPAARGRNPVRFPALNLPKANTPPSPIDKAEDMLAEAAELAREMRSALEPVALEPESRRRAIVIGAGAVAVLAIGLLTVRFVGGRHPAAAHPAAQTATRDIAAAKVASQSASASAPVSTSNSPAPSHASSLAPVQDKGTLDRPSRKKPPSQQRAPRSQQQAARDADQPQQVARASLASSASLAPSTSGPALPPETPVGLTMAPPESAGPDNSAQLAIPAQANQASSTSSSAPAAAAATATIGASAAATPAPSVTTPAVPAPRSQLATTGAAKRPDPDEPPPVIREARLSHHVEADYPSAARREGIKGFVDLAVTVSPQGSVTEVSVTQSTPPGVFDKSALAAVRRYRYDPRYVDGLPAEAHLAVHLDFGTEANGR